MTKILIDEALLRRTLEVLEKYSGVDQRACDVEEAINQALANEALNKKADNARELGLSYEQPAQPWVGLTVTEQNELCRKTGASRHQVRSVEAKLKEKNT